MAAEWICPFCEQPNPAARAMCVNTVGHDVEIRRDETGRPIDPRHRISHRDYARIVDSVAGAPEWGPQMIADLQAIVHTDAAPTRVAREDAA